MNIYAQTIHIWLRICSVGKRTVSRTETACPQVEYNNTHTNTDTYAYISNAHTRARARKIHTSLYLSVR